MSETNLKRISIVAAEFNRPLIDAMVEAAQAELLANGAVVNRVLRVPGCYEVPLVVNREMGRIGVDAVVVLGYIERGETLHGEVMGNVVHAALVDLQLKYGKPMGLGIIGPGATEAQADVRKESYARSAVRASLRNLELPPIDRSG